MEKVYVTQEGYEQLQAELRHLIDVVKPEVIQELKDARAQGDLSENADYDAARDRQSEVEGKISLLQAQIENAVIISLDKNVDEVNIGAYVLLHVSYLNKDVQYHIVGTTETKPSENKISNECELAKSIIGHHVGDTVTVKANKPYTATIKAISSKRIIK